MTCSTCKGKKQDPKSIINTRLRYIEAALFTQLGKKGALANRSTVSMYP